MLIIGLDNAGKTSMLKKTEEIFNKANPVPPEKIVPTIGLNIGKIGMKGCKLLVWDLGGQANIRKLWERYYEDAQAILFVVDTNDPDRFPAAREALESVLDQQLLGDVPILLLGNKRDLPTSLPATDVAKEIDAHKLIEEHPCRTANGMHPRVFRTFDVSAITGGGLSDAIKWLAEWLKIHPNQPATRL